MNGQVGESMLCRRIIPHVSRYGPCRLSSYRYKHAYVWPISHSTSLYHYISRRQCNYAIIKYIKQKSFSTVCSNTSTNSSPNVLMLDNFLAFLDVTGGNKENIERPHPPLIDRRVHRNTARGMVRHPFTNVGLGFGLGSSDKE